MKIKIAILDSDTVYLQRLVNTFYSKYPNKLEIYSFTELDTAVNALTELNPSVFLANQTFEMDLNKIPSTCAFAYLLNSPGINEFNGKAALCKFQKLEQIYKQILNLYSSIAGNTSNKPKISDRKSKIITFVSPSGGVGSSSMAAACAMHFAAQSHKVLYFNLELYSSTDVIFAADGQFCMSDVIFALKNKKVNLSIKLESYVKRDKSGVYFFSQPKLALDMLELQWEDTERLLSELISSAEYEYIIVDADFGLSPDKLKLYSESDAIVLVSDGSEISNLKLFRAHKAASILAAASDDSFLSRMFLLYNKFSKKTSKAIDLGEDANIIDIGGAPKIENVSNRLIVEKLSNLDVFDNIMYEGAEN